jgi:OHCU decarboxylase
VAPLPAIEQLNGLDDAAAQSALAPLFEGAPRFIVRLLAERPYRSWDELLDQAASIAARMPDDEVVELINSHPRIGAAPQSVSALSFREQGYDRDHGSTGLQAELDRLNSAYEQRFGFRFVIFVAGRPRSDIAPIIGQRLAAGREEEMQRAVGDIVAIARDRLSTMGATEEGP